MNDQDREDLLHAIRSLRFASEAVKTRFTSRKDAQTSVYGRCYAYCSGCFMPLIPSPKGNGKPGFVGFLQCCNAKALYITDTTN